MSQCSWCPNPASTSINIGRGRKLQLVPACGACHARVEASKDADEAERQKAKETKKWW